MDRLVRVFLTSNCTYTNTMQPKFHMNVGKTFKTCSCEGGGLRVIYTLMLIPRRFAAYMYSNITNWIHVAQKQNTLQNVPKNISIGQKMLPLMVFCSPVCVFRNWNEADVGICRTWLGRYQCNSRLASMVRAPCKRVKKRVLHYGTNFLL